MYPMSDRARKRETVTRWRAKLRARGLRPVQIWVPDTKAPGFATEYARQFRVASEHPDPDVDALLDELNADLARELNARDS